MKKKYDNMSELAQAIGVSRPTLSKYFHDSAHIRESTRQKIDEALKQVDYVPNFFARNLNRKRTKLLGFIVPHLNDLFYTSLIEEVENCAFANGYTLLVQNAHNDFDREIAALETLRSMNADGVIIAPVGNTIDQTALERLRDSLPLVFVDATIEGLDDCYPFVGTNNQQTIRLMVDYLCRSGKPPIFLGMPRVNSNSSERQAVYCQRMVELGHKPVIISAKAAADSWDFEHYAYHTMSGYFRSGKYLDDTILCANDRLAFGVIKAINEAKLWEASGSTQAIRVAGHDDYPMSEYVSPGLTTVSQNTRQIGQRAFEILLNEMRGAEQPERPAPKVLLDGQLIIRASA